MQNLFFFFGNCSLARANNRGERGCDRNESTFYCNEGLKLFWMENGKKKLLPKSRGTSIMISGFMCPCHGFMSACIRGETHKSYKTFEAGKGREGWFTNKDLNVQFDACHELFRHFHPVENYGMWFAFDHYMTHKAKAPDGLDASKLNKSDGGASVVKQRDGWYDLSVNGVTERIVQKMQNDEGGQLGLHSILKARGKLFLKLPDGQYSGHELKKLCNGCKNHTDKDDPTVKCCMFNVLSNEPDFLAQKSWLSETIEKYPGCFLFFYPKYHCELNFIEMVWGWIKS